MVESSCRSTLRASYALTSPAGFSPLNMSTSAYAVYLSIGWAE